MVQIQIDNEKECYGPGDPVTGSVIFSSALTIYVGAVVVTFSAKSNVAFELHSANTALFSMSTTLYENDKLMARPLLQPGQHQWPFNFTFPDSERLPPSFAVNWRFRASVNYELEAKVSDETGGSKARTYLKFSPHRLASLEEGPMPYSSSSSPSRSVLGGLRKVHKFTLDLSIPRFVVMGEAIPLRLGITLPDNVSDAPIIRLKSFKTTLHIDTTIKDPAFYGGAEREFETCQASSGKDLNIILQPAEQINLHELDPTFKLSRDTKLKAKRNYHVSPVVPSFSTTNITRTYKLSVIVEVKDKKTTLSAHFSGRELVILPAQLSPKIALKPPELDEDAALLELPDERPEAWSGRKGQIDTIELPAVSRPVELQ